MSGRRDNLTDNMCIISGTANPAFAAEVAHVLDMPQYPAVVGRFPDREISVDLTEDIRGRDVYIIQPTVSTSTGSANDHLMELLILMDAARRASASRITAVIPYFGYARQDRRDKARAPITAKLVSNMIVAAGADHVLVIDLHSAQIQGFFDIPVDHIYARPLFINMLRSLPLQRPVVVSADAGGVSMSRSYAKRLNADLAIIDKRRVHATKTIAETLIGDVRGRDTILVDDMISTGETIIAAAEALKNNGAKNVFVCATHGLFSGNAVERMASAPIERIFITDSIPNDHLHPVVNVVSIASLVAEAIRRIHTHESLTPLSKEMVT